MALTRLTKKAFIRWLENKGARTRVGKPENRLECPLCEFLKAQGARDVLMNFDDKFVDDKHSDNPLWAKKFQHAACDFIENDEEKSITAKRALSFL